MLPLAAIVITALCVYRYTRPTPVVVPVQVQPRMVPPPFDSPLLDHNGNPFKLQRYFGRQPVILVFLAEGVSPVEDETVTWLRENARAVDKAGYEVVVVTDRLPSATKAEAESAGIEWDFPIVSDVVISTPVPGPLHQVWGRFDRESGELTSGTFVIDRMGRVAADEGRPQPLDDPTVELGRLITSAS